MASHDGTRDVSLLEGARTLRIHSPVSIIHLVPGYGLAVYLRHSGARTVRIHSPVSDGLAYLAMVSHCACVTAYEHTHIGPQVITSSRELTRAG